MTGDDGGLLERTGELGVLDAALSGAGGCTVVVAGPPGIGTSALLRAAAQRATAAGTRVLSARGALLEQSFAFGVARALLEGAVRAVPEGDRADLLSGAARHAAPILDLAGGDPGPGDLHASLHGLHWLVAGLAARGPLVLVVDDAQWADEPSLRFLAYLVPRVAELPVTVLLGARHEGGPSGSPARDALLGAEGVTVLRPAPLGDTAVAAVIAAVLGAAVQPGFAGACAARTGGSPFLVAELAAALRDAGIAPVDANAARVGSALPTSVGDHVLRQLATASAQARALAEALAVLGEDDPAGTVRALAGQDARTAAAAAQELADAHLLAPGRTLALRHPLLRDAALGALPPVRAALLHGHAARVLADVGGPPARVVAHLLAGGGGDGAAWAVARLRREARSALDQGAATQAATYLRRALAEPPDAAQRPAVLGELGAAELAALDPAAAGHLAEALQGTDDPAARAEVALVEAIAHYHAGRHADAAATLVPAIDALGPEHREQRLNLEAFLGIAGRYDLATADALRGRLAGVARGMTGATPGERVVLATLAQQEPGTSADGLAAAARADGAVFDERPWPDPSKGVGTVLMFVHAGDPAAAAELAERIDASARDAGSPVLHAFAVTALGAVALDVGRLREAEADFRTALDAMVGLGLAPVRTTVGILVQVLAERGDLQAAEELLAEHDAAGPVPERMLLNPLLFGRGTLRAAQGRFAEAAEDLQELGRRHGRWDMQRPSPDWRSGAALALAALGDHDAARALTAEQLALARAWGSPRSLGPVLRAAALVGEDQDRRATLEEAVMVLTDTPWALELARARCDLGAQLRREGSRRAARALLEPAMDAAHALGAEPIARRAADELRASGARPRRRALSGVDALTPAEARVAALAAAGRSNRNIAQELFLSLATVETHLTRSYRKLDIAGREELAAVLRTRTA